MDPQLKPVAVKPEPVDDEVEIVYMTPKTKSKVAIISEPELPPLPPGWEIFTSNSNRPGLSFFFHRETGCKTWTRPDTVAGHVCDPDCAGFKKQKKMKLETEAQISPDLRKVKKEEAGMRDTKPDVKQELKPLVKAEVKTEDNEVEVRDVKLKVADLDVEIIMMKLAAAKVNEERGGQSQFPPRVALTPGKVPMEPRKRISSPESSFLNAKVPKKEAVEVVATPHLDSKSGMVAQLKSEASNEVPSEDMEWENKLMAQPLLEKFIMTKVCFVLNTDVLMNELEFVAYLRDSNHTDLKEVVLLVPWAVVLELERSNQMILQGAAEVALRFIRLSMRSKASRIAVQSSKDCYKINVLDTTHDQVLRCCQELGKSAEVFLLTSDASLQTKAAFQKLPFHSVESMRQILFPGIFDGVVAHHQDVAPKVEIMEFNTTPKVEMVEFNTTPRVEMMEFNTLPETSSSVQPNHCKVRVEATAPSAASALDEMTQRPDPLVIVDQAKSIVFDLFSHILTTELQEKYGCREKWVHLLPCAPYWDFLQLMHSLDMRWAEDLTEVIKRPETLIGKIKVFCSLSLRVNARSKCEVFVRTCLGLVNNVKRQRYLRLKSEAIQELQKLVRLEGTCPPVEFLLPKVKAQLTARSGLASGAQDEVKELFGYILAQELMGQYGNQWTRYVPYKWPWSFQETMHTIEQHWKTLSDVVDRDGRKLAKIAHGWPLQLDTLEKPLSRQQTNDVIKTCLGLVDCVKANKYKCKREESINKLKLMQNNMPNIF